MDHVDLFLPAPPTTAASMHPLRITEAAMSIRLLRWPPRPRPSSRWSAGRGGHRAHYTSAYLRSSGVLRAHGGRPSLDGRPPRGGQRGCRRLCRHVIPSGIGSTATGPTLPRPPGYESTDRLEHIAWRRHAVQHPAALAAGPTPITCRPSIILSCSEPIAGAMGRSETAQTYTFDEYLTFGVAQQLSGASELLRTQRIRDLVGRWSKAH